ncbi:MAG: hypothetical protein ACRCY9_05480 [Phycicoccus sp.]
MSGTRISAAPPSAHRRALIVWVAVYPTITLVLALLGPLVHHWPLPLQTLLVTAVVVPPVTYVLIPALTRLERRRALTSSEGRTPGM